MDILRSKNVSLTFAILNGVFALQAVSTGSWAWALICLGCCGWCANNYKNAE